MIRQFFATLIGFTAFAVAIGWVTLGYEFGPLALETIIRVLG